jgi:hypothetical protein
VAVGNGGFIDGAHGPIAFLYIARLGAFELIDGPEDREPAFGIVRSEAGEMRGINDEDGVKFETDWTRLDVADAGQKERREYFLVGRAAVDALGDFFEDAFARGVFEQAHERLDVGMKTNDVFGNSCFGGGDGRQAIEKTEAAHGGSATRPLKEISARDHEFILVLKIATSIQQEAQGEGQRR